MLSALVLAVAAIVLILLIVRLLLSMTVTVVRLHYTLFFTNSANIPDVHSPVSTAAS
jgi:hypothetical protein